MNGTEKPETWTANAGGTSWGNDDPAVIRLDGLIIAKVMDRTVIYDRDKDEVDFEAMRQRDHRRALLMADAPKLLDALRRLWERQPEPRQLMADRLDDDVRKLLAFHQTTNCPRCGRECRNGELRFNPDTGWLCSICWQTDEADAAATAEPCPVI